MEVERDAVIITEGTGTDSLFWVVSGVLSVEKFYDGVFASIANLAAGDIFGEMSFLEERNATANVRALEKSVIDVVPQIVMVEAIGADPRFGVAFYRWLAQTLSRRLRQTASVIPALTARLSKKDPFTTRH